MTCDIRVTELEFRSIREHDKFLVKCNTCGNERITYDRRWPSPDMVEHLRGVMCSGPMEKYSD